MGDMGMSRGWSFLIGVACLLGSVYFAQRSLEFRRHGEVVDGTVIAVDARISSDDDGFRFSRRAVVEYTPRAGGKPLTLRTNWSSGWFAAPAPGDRLPVRYLPEKPEQAREDNLLDDWLGPLALLALGIGGITGNLRSSRGETVWWRRGED